MRSIGGARKCANRKPAALVRFGPTTSLLRKEVFARLEGAGIAGMLIAAFSNVALGLVIVLLKKLVE